MDDNFNTLFLLTDELGARNTFDTHPTQQLHQLDIIPTRVFLNVKVSDLSENEHLFRLVLRCFSEYVYVNRLIMNSKSVMNWVMNDDPIFKTMRYDKYTIPTPEMRALKEITLWNIPLSESSSLLFSTDPRHMSECKWILNALNRSNTISGIVTNFTSFHFHATIPVNTYTTTSWYSVKDVMNTIPFETRVKRNNAIDRASQWIRDNLPPLCTPPPTNPHITHKLGKRQIHAITSYVLLQCGYDIAKLNRFHHTFKLYSISRRKCQDGGLKLVKQMKFHLSLGGSLAYPPPFEYKGKPPLYHMLSNKMIQMVCFTLYNEPNTLAQLQHCNPSDRRAVTQMLLNILKKSERVRNVFTCKLQKP